MNKNLQETGGALLVRLRDLKLQFERRKEDPELWNTVEKEIQDFCQAATDLEQALARQKSLTQDLHESMERLLLLQYLSEVISRSKGIQDILSGFISIAQRAITFQIAGIYLKDWKSNGWNLQYALALEPQHDRMIQSHMDEGVISWVMLQKRPVAVPNLSHVTQNPSARMAGFIIIPMLAGDKQIGFTEIWVENLHGFNLSTHLNMIDFLARQTAIAIENNLLYEELNHTNGLLRQSQAQIVQSEKMAALGIMAGGLAHEINNPLQTVLSQAQFLLRKVNEERVAEALRLIERETVRMGGIVGSMLRYSRQQQQTTQARIRIEPIIEDVLILMRPTLVQHKIQVTSKLSEETPEIPLNAGEMEQVFLNLIENAIHATPPNGQLSIRTHMESSDLVVEVEDTGSGIPRETLSKIFIPFFTTKGPHLGTGLGLFLCHNIVERHRGVIQVESAVGKGTLFSIRFPSNTNSHEKNPAC